MSPTNQAMQNDMSLNPAMFWIMDGEALWIDRNNPSSKACGDCHSDVKQSMKGISATFPKRVQGKLLNLEGQINQCRTTRQQSPAFAYESKPLLALSTLIAYQSRGIPLGIRSIVWNGRTSAPYSVDYVIACRECGQNNILMALWSLPKSSFI
jgi:sulfur-oxidizing protein SoxA